MSRLIVIFGLIHVSHKNKMSYELMKSTKSSSLNFRRRPLTFHAVMGSSPSAYFVTSWKFRPFPSRTSSLSPALFNCLPAAFSLSKTAFMSLLFCSTALVLVFELVAFVCCFCSYQFSVFVVVKFHNDRSDPSLWLCQADEPYLF